MVSRIIQMLQVKQFGEYFAIWSDDSAIDLLKKMETCCKTFLLQT